METQSKYRMAGNNHNGLSLTDGCNNSGSIHSFALRISNSCANFFNSSLFAKSFLRTFLIVAFVFVPGVVSALDIPLSSGDMCGSDYHASFTQSSGLAINLNVTLNSSCVVTASTTINDNSGNNGNKAHYDAYNFGTCHFGSYYYSAGTYHLYYNSTTNTVTIETSANAHSCGPVLTSSPTSLSLSTTAPNASSSSTFTVSGSSLQGGVTVSLGTGSKLELCDTQNGTYSSSVVISQSDATSGKTMYVRIKANQSPVSNGNENIMLSSTSATSVNVPVTINITAPSITVTQGTCSATSNVFKPVGQSSVSAGTFIVTSTSGVASYNTLTITAPSGFVISTNDSYNSSDDQQTLTLTSNISSSTTYYVFFVGSSDASGQVSFGDAASSKTSCSFSAKIPTLSLSPSSIALSNSSTSQVVTITSNLSGATLQLSGTNASSFSVSPTSVTFSGGTATVTVSVSGEIPNEGLVATLTATNSTYNISSTANISASSCVGESLLNAANPAGINSNFTKDDSGTWVNTDQYQWGGTSGATVSSNNNVSLIKGQAYKLTVINNTTPKYIKLTVASLPMNSGNSFRLGTNNNDYVHTTETFVFTATSNATGKIVMGAYGDNGSGSDAYLSSISLTSICPPVVKITEAGTHAICSGTGDGTDKLTATVTNGTANYTYSWYNSTDGTNWSGTAISTTSGSSSTTNVLTLTSGSTFDVTKLYYRVIVEDANGLKDTAIYQYACGPELTVSPTSLSFSTPQGQASTASTLAVTGSSLEGNITVSLPGSSVLEMSTDGVTYTTNSITITKSGDTAEGTIYFRIKASATKTSGTAQETVTISTPEGAGTEEKTVTVNATVSGPVITATPTSLTALTSDWNTVSAETRTFTVSGKGLEGSVNVDDELSRLEFSTTGDTYYSYLSLSMAENKTVSATTVYVRISASALETEGQLMDSIIVNSTNADTQTVTIPVTVNGPEMTVSAASGSLTANYGGESNKVTFTVSGNVLQSDVTVSAVGTNMLLSTSENGEYSKSLTLSRGSGTLASTTVYAKIDDTDIISTAQQQTINVTSTYADAKSVTVSVTVVAPTISVTLDNGNCVSTPVVKQANADAGSFVISSTSGVLTDNPLIVAAPAGFVIIGYGNDPLDTVTIRENITSPITLHVLFTGNVSSSGKVKFFQAEDSLTQTSCTFEGKAPSFVITDCANLYIPNNLTKVVPFSLTDLPDGYTIRVTSSNDSLKLGTDVNYVSFESVSLENGDALYSKYIGDRDGQTATLTYAVYMGDSKILDLGSCTVHLSLVDASVSCVSQYANVSGYSFNDTTLVGHFTLTLKNGETVIDRANPDQVQNLSQSCTTGSADSYNGTGVNLSWAGVLIDLSGLGLKAQVDLPELSFGTYGIYGFPTSQVSNYMKGKNNCTVETCSSVNGISNYFYATYNSDPNCRANLQNQQPVIGRFLFDFNYNNDATWDNSNQEIYFYVEGDTLYYAMNSMPLTTITDGGAQGACLSDTVNGRTLTANFSYSRNGINEAVSGYQYKWLKNGVEISGATNATYTAKQFGNYTVRVSCQFETNVKTDADSCLGNVYRLVRTSDPYVVRSCLGAEFVPATGALVDKAPCSGSSDTLSVSIDSVKVASESDEAGSYAVWQYSDDGNGFSDVGSHIVLNSTVFDSPAQAQVVDTAVSQPGYYRLMVSVPDGENSIKTYSGVFHVETAYPALTITPSTVNLSITNPTQVVTVTGTCGLQGATLSFGNDTHFEVVEGNTLVFDNGQATATVRLKECHNVTINTTLTAVNGSVSSDAITVSSEACTPSLTFSPSSMALSKDISSQNVTLSATCGITSAQLTLLDQVNFEVVGGTSASFVDGVDTITVKLKDDVVLTHDLHTSLSASATLCNQTYNTATALSIDATGCAPENLISDGVSELMLYTISGDLYRQNQSTFVQLNTNGILTSNSSITLTKGKSYLFSFSNAATWGGANLKVSVGSTELFTFETSTNGVVKTHIYTPQNTISGSLKLTGTNCISTISVSSICPPFVSLEKVGSALVCSGTFTGGDKLVASVENGTSPFTYIWKKGESVITDSTRAELCLNNSTVFTSGATYSVIVTDNNGTKDTAQYTYNCSPMINTISNDTVCFESGNTASINVNYTNFTGFEVDSFSVYDSNDNLVFTKTLNPSVTAATTDSENLSFSTEGESRGDSYWSVKINYTETTGSVYKQTEPTTFRLFEKQMCDASISDKSVINVSSDGQQDTFTVNNLFDTDVLELFGNANYTVEVIDNATSSTVTSSKMTYSTSQSYANPVISVNKAAAATDGTESSYTIKLTSQFGEVIEKTFAVKQVPFGESPSVRLAATPFYCQGQNITITLSNPQDINTSYDGFAYTIDVYSNASKIGTINPAIVGDNTYMVGASETGTLTFKVNVSATGYASREISSTSVSSAKNPMSAAISDANASYSTTECENLTLTKTINVTSPQNGATMTYSWKQGGTVLKSGSVAVSSLTSVYNLSLTHNFTTIGANTVTLEVSLGCHDVSKNVTVTVAECTFDIPSVAENGYCDGEIDLSVNITSPASSENFITPAYTLSRTDAGGGTYNAGSWSGNTIHLSGLTASSYTFKVEVFADVAKQIKIGEVTEEVVPGDACVQNYFVNNQSGVSGNGSSWAQAASAGADGAFNTIDEALLAAATLHANEATANKQIAIYVSKNGGDYAVNGINGSVKTDTLKNISIYGGYNYTDGTSTEYVTGCGYTAIKNTSNRTDAIFKISDGKNVISHLDFNDAVGSSTSVIYSANNTVEEQLEVNDCKFQNNDGGAIKLNSTNGGKLEIYDSKFITNTPEGSAQVQGAALNIVGPYELIVSTKDNVNKMPATKDDTTDWRDCSADKSMIVNLLDPADSLKCANLFDRNAYTGSGQYSSGVLRGGAVHLDGLSSVLIESSFFTNNYINSNSNIFGAVIYIGNTNSLNFRYSYLTNNKTNSNETSEGAVLFTENIANTNYSYLWFNNTYMVKGLGGAFASHKSTVNVSNSMFSNGKITQTGRGASMYATESSLISIADSKFYKNTMTSGDGTCAGSYVSGAAVNVTHSVYVENEAQQNGAAFYTEGKNGTSYDPNTLVSVTKCLFMKNKVSSGQGAGPAIMAKNSRILINKTEFYQNYFYEKGGTITLENCYSNIFSSSFVKNTYGGSRNQTAACVDVNGGIGDTTANVIFANCTMTENVGNQYGVISALNGAKVDIISSSIINNDCNGTAILYKNGTGSRINMYNSIVSGNTLNGSSDGDNVLSLLTTKKYNTIGESIYFDNGGTSIGTTQLEEGACSSVSFSVASDLTSSYCSYGPNIVSTTPFLEDHQTCRSYGMSRLELRELAGTNSTLLDELLSDEHDAPRAWRNLDFEHLAMVNLTDSMRTYQGAVEGGLTLYEGQNFTIDIMSMPALCTGGELHQPYLDIDITGTKTEAGKQLTTNLLTTRYGLDIKKINGTDTTLVVSQKPIEAVDSIAVNLFSVYMENVVAGLHLVTVTCYDSVDITKPVEFYSKSIDIPQIYQTALAWTGAANDGNYNNIQNWKYRNADGTLGAVPTLISKPSSCFDAHIGWDNPDTETSDHVSKLPTIIGSVGECADVYFHPGGSLGNVHRLSYKKAHVEMALKSKSSKSTLNMWYLLAPPLKEVYTADYYSEDRTSYMRYITAKKDGDNYSASWSLSMRNYDVLLSQSLLGCAFKYYLKKPLFADTTMVYTFPNSRTKYTYVDTKEDVFLNKTDYRYRFLFEDDNNKFDSLKTVTIDLVTRFEGLGLSNADSAYTEKLKADGGYYIVLTNPYMSHLDLDKFYEDNSDVIAADIKLLPAEVGDFVSYSNGISNNMTKYVAPLQSFLVKPLSLGATLSLKFDASRLSVASPTDDTKNLLRSSTKPTDMLNLQLQKSGYVSVSAYVMANETATADYRLNEDVQNLLAYDALLDIYTHAGNVIVETNVLNRDSLTGIVVPVTLYQKTAGNVTVQISNADAFVDADEIYWVDSLSSPITKTPLSVQSTFVYNLPKGNTSKRFYLFFEQKPRVREYIDETMCLGSTLNTPAGTFSPTTPGNISMHQLKESNSVNVPDTSCYVNLDVKPSYKINISDSIYEAMGYRKNGFRLPIQDTVGVVHDTLRLSTVDDCDSLVYLSLKVKKRFFDVSIFYGKPDAVLTRVDSMGNGLNLNGNALAVFDEDVPVNLCSKTNVLCKNNSSYEAHSIVLSDSADLYIPYDFFAENIVYKRKPSIFATLEGGWESIVLPFKATEFRNSGREDNAGLPVTNMKPFSKIDNNANGDFWLKKFVTSQSDALGFDAPDVPVMEAYVPYLVAFPGTAWGEEYSLIGQTISYSASNASVSATPTNIKTSLPLFDVYGTTGKIMVNNCYTLNSSLNKFLYSEGLTSVLPFRLYVTSIKKTPSPFRSLSIYNVNEGENGDGYTDQVDDANSSSQFAVYEKDGELCIYSSTSGEADVYDMKALKVVRSKVKYTKGETLVLGLPAGVYVVNNVKCVLAK